MSYVVKIALVGDYGVGKTCIVSRFARDYFPMTDMSTLGVDFDSKVIEFKENNYKLQIWDTAGQEKFQSIVKSYIRDVNVCILVFDVNHMKTFQNLKKWLDHVIYITEVDNTVLQVVGNKTDLKGREVPREMVEEFCNEHNLDYIECSAKNDDNIEKVFYNVIGKVDDLLKQDKIELRSYGFFKEVNTKKNIQGDSSKKCCTIS
jgi:Ras-related protein Rab-8A